MNLENPSSKIINMSKAHYTVDDILNWENITPTATLNNASMEEIMYGYDQLKTRQHTLLKSGIYINIECSISNRGYKYFQLNRNKKRINFYVHYMSGSI